MLRAFARVGLIGLLGLWVAVAPSAARATCKTDGKKPEVSVKAKTPVRRGPGLNYPVNAFIETQRCMRLGEVSMDERWVRIEDDGRKIFGWVPAAQIEEESLAAVSEKRPAKGPDGSGQERGYVSTREPVNMVARPSSEQVRRALPPGSELLALSVTADGRWLEVRDDRGETGWVPAGVVRDDSNTLAGLPRAEAGIKTGMEAQPEGEVAAAPPPSGPSEAPRVAAPPPSRDLVPKDEIAEREERGRPLETKATGVEISMLVLGHASLPQDGLDTNSINGLHRYAVRAFAAGARIEMQAAHVGPLRARLGYAFNFLSGLKSSRTGESQLNGQEHEGRLVFGVPIEIGGNSLLTPEIGYTLSIFGIQPTLTGSPEVSLVSSHSHHGTVGLSAKLGLFASFGLDLEGAAMIGMSSEYPYDIGKPGIGFGALAAAGFHVDVTDGFSILARWDLRYRRTTFSGPALLDPTITEAKLTHFEHLFSAGVGFGL